MARHSTFNTAREPACSRYRRGAAKIFFCGFRLRCVPKGAAALGRLALIMLVTAAALAKLTGLTSASGASYEAALEQLRMAPEKPHAPFSYFSIRNAFDHDDTSHRPEAYCQTYKGGASASVPENPGARAVFPMPEEYLNSYEDTWGAPRPQGGHEGTDLMVPTGTPEYAITDGTIVPVAGSNENGWNSLGGYAVMLEADHSVGPIKKGDLFYYAHLDEKSALPAGTKVRAGEQIGVAGDTGQGPEATRGLFPPHLHLGWYDATGTTSSVTSGAMNPYPLLEWLKKNGGAVVGGWGSEGATAEYCEYQDRAATAPPPPASGTEKHGGHAHDSHQDASPGSSADLDTGSSDPSPVLKRDAARDAPAGQNVQAPCRGNDGGRRSIAPSDAWRAVLPEPARSLYSLVEWTGEGGGVFSGACEDDPAAVRPTQPGNGEAEDLLATSNFEASPQAVEDLKAGIVDERLIATLQAIVEEHRIYVNVFKTGHTFGSEFPEGPIIPTGYGSGGGHPNTHYFGRAADIWEVDGSSILGCGSHPAVVDVGRMLAGITPEQRPDVIIGPSAWNAALGYPREAGWIPDDDQVARHEDHLHIGFYGEKGTSNTVSPALESRGDTGEEKQDEACSGGPPEPPGAPLSEHRDGYQVYPEARVVPKESAASRNDLAEGAAGDENQPDKMASPQDQRKAVLKAPGRVVPLQTTAPERRSSIKPEPEKPAHEEAERSGHKRPEPRKAEQGSPGTRGPVPRPEKPDPKEPGAAPNPKEPEPGNEEPKSEEPAPRPTPGPVAGGTGNLEPDRPANEELENKEPEESAPGEPETGKTEPDKAGVEGPGSGNPEPPETELEELERPEPETPKEPELEPESAPEPEAGGHGSILPIAFRDRNGDGTRDAGEEQLAGWTATLAPVGSAAELSTLEAGTRFEGLAVGHYIVTVKPAAGYASTSPKEERVGLGGQQDQQAAFGFVQLADVTVLVCDDANGDGSCAGEGVPNTSQEVWLLNSEGDTLVRGVSEPNGRYHFNGLRPGSYTLIAESPDRAGPEGREEMTLVIQEGDSLVHDFALP